MMKTKSTPSASHYGHVIVCSCPLLPPRCEELWCGLAQQRSGKLSVWNMTSQQHRELTHAQQAENRTVHAVVTDADGDACWTYVYPGSEVYRWNVDVKQVTHVVDLAHVVPRFPPESLAKHVSKDFFMGMLSNYLS